jgi:molybdate transport system ATP-binding protein
MAAAAPLIIARNASVWLDRRLVLRRLDFSIAAGDCWVVHGANGSGKSTLLRALHGDHGIASHGEIRRRGIDAGVALSEFRTRVGFVAPEWQALHPLHLRVREVVASGLHASVGLAEHSSASERRSAMAALRRLGAGAWAERELRELSYGQLRRVLFARALVRQPDILLLDELYAGLDATVRLQLMRRVGVFLAAGGTLVLSTHHRDDWPQQTSHELQLSAGRAFYCGPVRWR